ncbi:MAG: excinuclease ABC subunit UvrB [Elusimicrobiota bacterium]
MAQPFKVVSKFKPSGDQPDAIAKLAKGVLGDKKHQVLLGVTGSGKTYAIAKLIEKTQKPALVISPNKILAAQLYAEFKSFFPDNAVEYFISYYDYYQPEAYIPQTDTYIEKDSDINDHIDRLRLKATSSLLERNDVIIVASVSCIYNLGTPEEYQTLCVSAETGSVKSRDEMLKELVNIHYERSDIDFFRGKFRVRGDTVEVFPAYLETALRLEFYGDKIERITEIDALTGKVTAEKEKALIYPAKHFVTTQPKLEKALVEIEAEMIDRIRYFNENNKLLEAQRIGQRTRYDMEMLKEMGTCHGVENYSRHLSGRAAGSRPSCLIDYFNASGRGNGFITVIDESHITAPQIRGMYEGDKSRKQTLVDFGFRLPSAMDNRPLKFPEFESLVKQAVYVSATPGPYELGKSSGGITELIIRPTGLIDPAVEVRPLDNQIGDLISEIEKVVNPGGHGEKGRVLVTTLTKRLSEDLTDYLGENKLKVRYLHSEIDSLKRIEILRDLRLGKFDVLVGINLLREGLDLPEVALVAVLDADKEGFLRSETSLIQVCGRASRNLKGRVILYADKMTGSMERALNEMSRRRKKQEEYNKEHNITPKSIVKAVHDLEEFQYKAKETALESVIREATGKYISARNMPAVINELEKQMREAADNLNFELAAALRDRIYALREMNVSKKQGKR